MAGTNEEGGGEAAAGVHLPGVQDERASRRALDDGSLDQLRHRHAVTNRQARRALDTAGRCHAMPVVAIAHRRLFYRRLPRYTPADTFFFRIA